MRGPNEVASSQGYESVSDVWRESEEGTHVSDGAGFGLSDEHGEELVVDLFVDVEDRKSVV